jgi:outer membrane protein OmpU
MYKLLATSALVAAGLWATADAAMAQAKVAPISVVVGGYHQQNFGYATNKKNRTLAAGQVNPNGSMQYSDSEVWFGGRTTLANGITVGFDVQLEANTSGDQIDESYLFVDGAFGRILIGSENTADYIMHYGAPGVGVAFGTNESQVTDFILRPAAVTALHTTASGRTAAGGGTALTHGTGNDQQRLSYFTPRFAGVQVGLSFTPNVNQEDSTTYTDRNAQRANAVHGSINYSNNFSGVQINGSLGASSYPKVNNGSGLAPATSPLSKSVKDYSAGLQIGASGFMVGGGYRKLDADLGAENGSVWALGASYTTGPLSVGASYLSSEVDGAAAAGKDKFGQVLFAAAYSIGPGVDLIGALFHAKYDDEGNATVNENSGTGGALGIHLRF